MKTMHIFGIIIWLGMLRNISSTLTSAVLKKNLMQYYEKKLNFLSNETCLKFENITQKILKDDVVQLSQSDEMLELKENIKQFQELSEIYRKYNLNDELALIFANIAIKYYYRESSADSESLYILQLIRKLGYDEICDLYEKSFIKFIINEFLPQVADVQKIVPRDEAKTWHKFFKWAKELAECKHYNCFYSYSIQFREHLLTPKELLFFNAQDHRRRIQMFYASNMIRIVKGVLKSEIVSLIPNDIKENLYKNISTVITAYEQGKNFTQFFRSVEWYSRLVVSQFGKNSAFPYKGRLLLEQIFDIHGFNQLDIDFRNKYRDFVENDLSKQFKQFRDSLTPSELLKERLLLDLMDDYRILTSFEEQDKHFAAIIRHLRYDLLQDSWAEI